jgi:hypothetical protein
MADFWPPFASDPSTIRLKAEVNMRPETNAANGPVHDRDEADDSKDIAVIREQTFESLQILRNLLSLLMPKEDDDGPKLVDLIAALVAQQRDILVGINRVQADMNALFDRLDGKKGGDDPRKLPG